MISHMCSIKTFFWLPKISRPTLIWEISIDLVVMRVFFFLQGCCYELTNYKFKPSFLKLASLALYSKSNSLIVISSYNGDWFTVNVLLPNNNFRTSSTATTPLVHLPSSWSPTGLLTLIIVRPSSSTPTITKKPPSPPHKPRSSEVSREFSPSSPARSTSRSKSMRATGVICK